MKKLLALLLSVAMILSLGLTPVLAAEPETDAQKPVQFADLTDDHWAKKPIDRWSGYGIVNGDENGNVNADMPLRRCEMAQVLVNLLGLTQEAENTFGDLTGKEWYAGTILKCAAAGIMKGDGVNCNAEDPVSRQEAIVMFGRAMGVRPVADPDLTKFDDHADVADWAAPYMAPLTEMGILSGVEDGSNVAPKAEMNRASTFALLDKAIAVYANEPGEYKAADGNGFVVVNSAAEEAGQVVVSGEAAGVVVSTGTTDAVVVKDMTADTVKVDAPVDLTVEGKDTVLGSVQLNDAATVDVAKGVQVDTLEANAPATVTNNGTVDSLVANDAVKVDNQGTVKDATVNADGVVVDGKAPQKMEVAEGVTAPTDSKGETVEAKPSTNNIGSGPSTPSVTKYTVTVDKDIVGGEVTATPTSAAAGATINVTATAKDGYELGDVTYTVGSDTAVIEMTDGKGSFEMPKGNVTVSATFTEKDEPTPPTPATEYTITVDVDPTVGGTVTPSKDKAEAGTEITLTVAPAEGYELSTLTYTADGKTEDIKEAKSFTMPAANVTVKASFKAVTPAVVAVTSVTLDKTSADVYITDNNTNPTMKLVATVKPDNATDKTVTWDSSDETVATVNDAGLVTALKAGETTITATAGGKIAACDIKVIDKRTPAPTVDKTALEAAITAAEAAKAGVVVADNAADVAQGTNYVTNAQNTALETAIADAQAVADNANATQKEVDDAKTALETATNTFNTAKDSQVGTKVDTVAVESVSLDKTEATIYTIAGDAAHPNTIQLNATVNPDNATNKAVTWSSGDQTVATVSDAGVVTGLKEGKVEITVTTADGGKTAKCLITVVPSVDKTALTQAIADANAAKLDITIKEDSVTVGQVTEGDVFYHRSDVNTLEDAIRAAESVKNNADATQSEVDNAATTLSIAVTAFTNAKLTGEKIAVTGVTLNKTEDTVYLIAGDTSTKTIQLTATVNPDNATNNTVTWSSFDENVATVDENGLVTIKGSGMTRITATADGVSASCVINVYVDGREEISTMLQNFYSKLYNLNGYSRTKFYDSTTSTNYAGTEGYTDISTVVTDLSSYRFCVGNVGTTATVGSISAGYAVDMTSTDELDCVISIGMANFLYTKPYEVDDQGNVYVNALALASRVDPSDGTVEVFVLDENSEELLSVTCKLFDFPEQNQLYVTDVVSLRDESVKINTPIEGNNEDGYTISGTYSEANHENLCLGINLSAEDGGAALGKDSGNFIISWDQTDDTRIALGITALGETIGDATYSYGIYPHWGANVGDISRTLLVPGQGFVTIDFVFENTDVTPAP